MNGDGPRDPIRDERANRDVAPLLSAWMDAVAPERPPARLLEEAFARTMTARQETVFPWHRWGGAGRSTLGWSRAGDLRVVYAIDDREPLVVVLAVARRSESTYRRITPKG